MASRQLMNHGLVQCDAAHPGSGSSSLRSALPRPACVHSYVACPQSPILDPLTMAAFLTMMGSLSVEVDVDERFF